MKVYPDKIASFTLPGRIMARSSKMSSKTNQMKARKVSPGTGGKTVKTMPTNRSRGTRLKRRSVSRVSKDLKEAREQQAATAEILKVIASSLGDVQPVFEAVVKSAARLFGPCGATITTLKDGQLHWNATEVT